MRKLIFSFQTDTYATSRMLEAQNRMGPKTSMRKLIFSFQTYTCNLSWRHRDYDAMKGYRLLLLRSADRINQGCGRQPCEKLSAGSHFLSAGQLSVGWLAVG